MTLLNRSSADAAAADHADSPGRACESAARLGAPSFLSGVAMLCPWRLPDPPVGWRGSGGELPVPSTVRRDDRQRAGMRP